MFVTKSGQLFVVNERPDFFSEHISNNLKNYVISDTVRRLLVVVVQYHDTIARFNVRQKKKMKTKKEGNNNNNFHRLTRSSERFLV